VTILGYHLVHWEDSESLAHGSLNIVNGCKEGPLLFKVHSYNYMFGAGPTWSPAYFVLRYTVCLLFSLTLPFTIDKTVLYSDSLEGLVSIRLVGLWLRV